MSFFNPFKKTHVFISYRRRSEGDSAGKSGLGERVSKHLYTWLIANRPNVDVFYDRTPSSKKRLRGEYWKQIQQELKKTTHLILILPPDALARCYEPDDEVEPEDVFGYEIRNALRQGCKIIPIFIGTSKDKEFRDKAGNVIPRRGYDLLPEKFREEAKSHNLLGLERYNVDAREDFLAEDDSDERANEKWNSIFTEEVLPRGSENPARVIAALAAIAAGVACVLYFNDSPAPVVNVPPSDNSETGTAADGAARISDSGETVGTDVNDAARKAEEKKKAAQEEEARQKAEEAARLRRETADADLRRALDDAADELAKKDMNPAALANALDRIKTAVYQGANPNTASKIDGQTPLHFATSASRLREFARSLLDGGANPNVRDSWGDTPLHNAVSSGDAECVRLLLERGADKSLRNNSNETPADLAAGNPELLRLLQ